MRLAHLTLAIATAATFGCATERAVAPRSANPGMIAQVSSNSLTTPPLYVVDGVRLKLDQVPVLNSDDVLSVSVMKGHLALQKYGPEAAYGVVIVRTKAGNIPQT
jgi:hypothetical protein